MSLLLHFTVCVWGFNVFCTVFVCSKQFYLRDSKKLNNYSYFFAAICKSGPFYFYAESQYVCFDFVEDVSLLILCYIRYYVACFDSVHLCFFSFLVIR
jgi:hypothetical protein